MTGEHSHIDLKERDSEVSSIDIKSKIIIVFFFIIVSTLIISFEQLFLLLIFTCISFYLFKVDLRGLIKKLLIPMPLLISLALLSYFSHQTRVLSFGSTHIHYSNLELSILFFIRSIVMVAETISLVESEDSFYDVIYGLDDLGMPEILVSILLLMYRSALDMMVEGKRMIDARYSRGTYRRWGSNLYTYRILGYMVAGILVRAFTKRELRRDALYSRNFGGKLYHKPTMFRFNGLLLLWISLIGFIMILANPQLSFLNLGEYR